MAQISRHSIKTTRYPKKPQIICITCKNKVEEYKLKQEIKFAKNGSWKVKGICPICKQFAKWIKNDQSEFYGRGL